MDINNFEGIDLGKALPPELVKDLLVEGRVSFEFKPTDAPNIKSSSADLDEVDQDRVDNLVNDIKNTEDLIKALEDANAANLIDMNISTAGNPRVAAAASNLNPDGNPNITAETLDIADNIINLTHLATQGFDPILLALTGDGSIINGNFVNCNELTNAAIAALKPGADLDNPAIDNPEVPPTKTTEDTMELFWKKLAETIKFLFLVLWWENIWGRVISMAVCDPLKTLVAIPTDIMLMSILWVFSFFTKEKYKPSKENAEANGFLTPVLNRFKIWALCTFPKMNFKQYKPDPNQTVFVKENDKMVEKSMVEFCKSAPHLPPCPPKTNTEVDPQTLDEDPSAAELMNTMDQISAKVSGEGDRTCIDVGNMGVSSVTPNGFGFPPQCMQDAVAVRNYAMSDALNGSSYNYNDSRYAMASQGDIAGVRDVGPV